LRRGQDIVRDRDVEIEPFRVAGDIRELPALCFNIESAFGVGKALPREVNHAIHTLEIILQRMRFA
jgi:hypothetical protein